MDVTESRCADEYHSQRQHCRSTSRLYRPKPKGQQPLSHRHTETHSGVPLVCLTIRHISTCKDFFIGICHTLSFLEKTAVPSYEVIALISGWLHAWTCARSFIVTVWFSPWIQWRHAKMLSLHDCMPQTWGKWTTALFGNGELVIQLKKRQGMSLFDT